MSPKASPPRTPPQRRRLSTPSPQISRQSVHWRRSDTPSPTPRTPSSQNSPRSVLRTGIPRRDSNSPRGSTHSSQISPRTILRADPSHARSSSGSHHSDSVHSSQISPRTISAAGLPRRNSPLSSSNGSVAVYSASATPSPPTSPVASRPGPSTTRAQRARRRRCRRRRLRNSDTPYRPSSNSPTPSPPNSPYTNPLPSSPPPAAASSPAVAAAAAPSPQRIPTPRRRRRQNLNPSSPPSSPRFSPRQIANTARSIRRMRRTSFLLANAPLNARAASPPRRDIPSEGQIGEIASLMRTPDEDEVHVEEDDCVICMEPLAGGTLNDLAQLSCGHCFHISCISGWFVASRSEDGVVLCPVCRAEPVVQGDRGREREREMKEKVGESVQKLWRFL